MDQAWPAARAARARLAAVDVAAAEVREHKLPRAQPPREGAGHARGAVLGDGRLVAHLARERGLVRQQVRVHARRCGGVRG